MSSKKTRNIAGMSFSGGKNENFFFCLLEHFEDSNRWFLTSVLQLRDEIEKDRNKVAVNWVEEFSLKELVVDFPLSSPACDTCTLECPGTEACPEERVVDIREQVNRILNADVNERKRNPKKYEQDRLKDDEYDHKKDILNKESYEYIVSKSFKRRLKKGYTPYWNRPIDFYVWKYYYDQLMSLFKISFDSFGNVPLMLMKRYNYLKKHFAKDLSFYESRSYLCLLELYRSKVLDRRHLQQLQDIHDAPKAREAILKLIEKKLNVFIYDQDVETITKNPKAFDSFLLAIVGKSLVEGTQSEIDPMFQVNTDRFLIPTFKK